MKEKIKKIFSGATAIIAALAILTSGALAWYAGTTAINAFKGTLEGSTEPMANLHDDFANPSAGGEIDKNVYVENTGNTDVYVRIMLTEIIKFGEDEETTKVHKPSASDVADCGKEHGTFIWTMGNTDKGEYDYTSIKDGGGWAGKSENEKAALVADGLGSAQTPAKVDLTGKTPNKKTSTTDVITMYEYSQKNDIDKVAYVGWVYDEDGYAYWSKPLKQGEATGLLLSAVTVPDAGTMDYEYDIIVNMEFVDIIDIGAWINGDVIKEGPKKEGMTTQASDDAQELLKDIAGMNESGRAIPTEVGAIYTDNNDIDWLILTSDGDGNVLMTTTSVQTYTGFYSSDDVKGSYVNSTLETKMKEFTASLADDLEVRMQGVDFAGEFAWLGVAPYGLSVVDNGKDKTAFALSKQEVEEYIIGNAELADSIDDWYWLRTLSPSSNSGAIAYPGDDVDYDSILGVDYGVRPALWISTQ